MTTVWVLTAIGLINPFFGSIIVKNNVAVFATADSCLKSRSELISDKEEMKKFENTMVECVSRRIRK